VQCARVDLRVYGLTPGRGLSAFCDFLLLVAADLERAYHQRLLPARRSQRFFIFRQLTVGPRSRRLRLGPTSRRLLVGRLRRLGARPGWRPYLSHGSPRANLLSYINNASFAIPRGRVFVVDPPSPTPMAPVPRCFGSSTDIPWPRPTTATGRAHHGEGGVSAPSTPLKTGPVIRLTTILTRVPSRPTHQQKHCVTFPNKNNSRVRLQGYSANESRRWADLRRDGPWIDLYFRGLISPNRQGVGRRFLLPIIRSNNHGRSLRRGARRSSDLPWPPPRTLRFLRQGSRGH